MRAYCTYFDSGYLSRGLAMIESLRSVGEDGMVVVLALDDAAADGLRERGGAGLMIIRPGDLEAAYPQLLDVRDSRSRMEYMFTLTPWLTLHAMTLAPSAEWVTYLDADLWFFSPVDVVFAELEGASVGIVPHRFPADQVWREKYGRYNVGWVSFRADAAGRACLAWWAQSCLEWCYDRPEPGRFADQYYLNDFATVADAVQVISDPGVNTAPWNLAGHTVSSDPDGKPLVDGRPLVFFHFHGVSREGRRFRFKHATYRVRTTSTIRDTIYRPYVSRLAQLDGAAEATGRDRHRAGATMMGRLRSRLLTWWGDRRADYVDL